MNIFSIIRAKVSTLAIHSREFFGNYNVQEQQKTFVWIAATLIAAAMVSRSKKSIAPGGFTGGRA